MERKRTVRLLNVTTVLVFVVLVASAANLVIQPPEEEPDTEFYIFGSDSSGEPVAGRYVDSLRTANGSVYFGIEHDLDTTQQFTLIVQPQRASVVDESVNITGRTNLEPIRVQVEPGTTEVRKIELDRPIDRRYSRVAFLLYLGSAPQNPSIENAHRSTHVWLDT